MNDAIAQYLATAIQINTVALVFQLYTPMTLRTSEIDTCETRSRRKRN